MSLLAEEGDDPKAPLTTLVIVKVTRPLKALSLMLNVVCIAFLLVTLITSSWGVCEGNACLSRFGWGQFSDSNEDTIQKDYLTTTGDLNVVWLSNVQTCVGHGVYDIQNKIFYKSMKEADDDFETFENQSISSVSVFCEYDAGSKDGFGFLKITLVLFLCTILLLLVGTIMCGVGLGLATDSPRKFRLYRASALLLFSAIITISACLVVWAVRFVEKIPLADPNCKETNCKTLDYAFSWGYWLTWVIDFIIFISLCLLLLDGKKEESVCQEKVIYPVNDQEGEEA